MLAILISHSNGISSSSCDGIPLGLKLSKDTIYTYQVKISTTRWTKGEETNVNQGSNNFKILFYPISKDTQGFNVYEVVTDTNDSALLDLIGKKYPKLPEIYAYPYYPVGVYENKEQSPTPIKSVKCDQVFKTADNINSSDGKLTIEKKSINKVVSVNRNSIQMESRKDVTLKGTMEGTGVELSTRYFVDGTTELTGEETSFNYEYRTGYGDDRHTEIMKGGYSKKLIAKDKYKKPAMYFPELTLPNNTVPYYTSKDGLFIPITLNDKLSAKAYFNITGPRSYIDYSFYTQNFKDKPKNYFYPFEKLDIGKNVLMEPEIEILDADDGAGGSEYKVPCKIGNNIISKGVVTINDKERTLSFYEYDKNEKMPEKATHISIVDNMPIFDLTVNGTTVRTVISFDSEEPAVSTKLKKKLSLKTRKIAMSEKDPKENYIEKTDLLLYPPDRTYIKTEAVVKDLGNAPYDLKLGRSYIKNRILTINYKGGWLLLKD